MGKNKLFGIDDIEDLASEKTFERGEEYYKNGYVGKIIKRGNIFEGVVNGTNKYKVSFENINGELDFDCTCPYDFEGICKHSVALALAILDDKYTEDKTTETIKKISPESFEKCFKSATPEKKLSFLKQLLDKDTDLQSQFINFTESKTKKLDEITGINIIKIKKEIFSELSTLDFDDLWEKSNYSYRDGYYDDGEIMYDTANDLIEDVFKTYYKRSEEFIKKGNFIDAVRIILGMYEGSQDLPELDNDEYIIFDGQYNDQVQGILKENIEKLAREIGRAVKADEAVFTIIDLIFSRFHYYENEYKPKSEEDGEKIAYYPEDFDKLFLSLLNNEKTASYLYKSIMDNDLDCPALAFVILKIAELSEKDHFWIETAERFVEYEPEIAQKLLDKYSRLENKEDDFNRVSEIAFDKWPDKFNHYLIDNLNKDTQRKLYVRALNHYTSTKHSVKHYKELREYFSEKELKQFLANISRGYNHLFYIKLLEIEKYYKEILNFIEDHTDASDFDKLIEPIINIYSEECFSILKTKCQKAMNSYNRNRNTYHEMAKWLKLMKHINSKKEQSGKYISEIYNHKPNLPALKDEMKKAGLYK